MTFVLGVETTIPQEKIDTIAQSAGDKLNLVIAEVRKFVLIENVFDSVKFGLALWLLTYIGSWFNAMTLVILAWVGLFTIPKVRKQAVRKIGTVRFSGLGTQYCFDD